MMKFLTSSAQHMKVHRGNLKCTLCHIPFTKVGLGIHLAQIHPELKPEDRIRILELKEEVSDLQQQEQTAKTTSAAQVF